MDIRPTRSTFGQGLLKVLIIMLILRMPLFLLIFTEDLDGMGNAVFEFLVTTYSLLVIVPIMYVSQSCNIKVSVPQLGNKKIKQLFSNCKGCRFLPRKYFNISTSQK